MVGGRARLEVDATGVTLALAERQLMLRGRELTLGYGLRARARGARRTSFPLHGALWVARDVPHDDIGVWIAEDADATRVRRVFGLEPRPLLEPGGLDALRGLDALALRLRHAVAAQLGPAPRALELGTGFSKVLVLEPDDRLDVYQRGLFGVATRRVLRVHRDGRVVIGEAASPVCAVHARLGVTVLGDYVRFADPDGLDLARVPVPWITTEARLELARRIGDVLHAG